MALPVGDVPDEAVGTTQKRQDPAGDVEVGDLVAAADVVHLAGLSALDQQIQGAAVVQHVQPVADVAAVAVEWHGQAVDRVRDEQRNELLGKLVRPVVVGRAGDDHGHAVRGEIAVGQAVGAGLAGRVRIARPQLVALPACAFGHAAVDLVGGDLDEAPQPGCFTRGFEQHESAHHVGANEVASGLYRAIHVRLGREVHDDGRPRHEGTHSSAVADVRTDERVSRMVHDVVQVLETAGVCEFVERGHTPVAMSRQGVAHEIATDEPRPAGDQHVDH